jgi:hypothetical protein
MSPKIRNCIIHIGTEKTGTSSIQRFLAKNRAALADDGVLYPCFTGMSDGSQWGFVVAVMSHLWRSDIGASLELNNAADAASYRQRLIAAIDKELADRRDLHTLIVSSEHFHSQLTTPDRIQSLKDLLSRWVDEFRVIVYFRRQDRVAISHYSTQLKSGNPHPAAFPPDDTVDLPYYYDYGQIFENWAKVFGQAAMVPGLFESEELVDGDLISDFCEKAGLSPAGKPRSERVNESLNNRGVLLLRALNRQWPQAKNRPCDQDRTKLVSRISKQNRGKSYPVSRQAAERFFARFHESNQALAKQAFPHRRRPLFPDDFAEYPTQVSLPTDKLDKEVRDMIDARSKARAPLAEKVRRILNVGSFRLFSARFREKPQLPPLFLHVGLPKTATTTLRNTLFTEHSEIYYLGDSANQHPRGCRSEPIYQALQPLFWRYGLPLRVSHTRAKLRESLGDVADRTLVASWETLGQNRAELFQRMVVNTQAAFGGLRLIFTLRNPLTRLPSAYLQALEGCALKGQHHSMPTDVLYLPFDDWLYRTRPDGHDYRFVFGDNLRFAVQHLGVDNVGVFLLENLQDDPKDFYQRIATFLGIDVDEARNQQQKHLNLAITTEQVAWLQRINAAAAERDHWLILSPEERDRRFTAIRQEGSGEKYRVPLSDEQKAYISKRSQPLNRWVAETFKLDLQRYGYPL